MTLGHYKDSMAMGESKVEGQTGSTLRSKHKIRVKGCKGMNRNNLFGNYSKEYEPDMMSTTADGEETEFMSSEIDSKSRYQDSEYTSQ